MDCFPGAKIHHGTHILKNKTLVSPNVKVAILSFGLNNQEEDSSSLLERSVDALMETAQNTFPNAKVFMVPSNWSPQLPLTMQAWTKATGRHMWRHWSQYFDL